MLKYQDTFSDRKTVTDITLKRKPNFENIEKILRCECPDRLTLFEFFMNIPFFEELLEERAPKSNVNAFLVKGFRAAGYDYVTLTPPPEGIFSRKEQESKKSHSQNEGFMIIDEESFYSYPWPEPDKFDLSFLKNDKLCLPEGMKVIMSTHGGILENTISLLGYQNMCIMLWENPELLKKVIDKIGQIIYRYYDRCLQYDTVGACFTNDDWGFKTQTMISPDDMRKYIIPWHRKFTELIHGQGRYAILHSCGMLWELMEDIVNVVKSDGKHSYEDNITSVEDSYERLSGRIAVLGGIDLDFICRKTPREIYNRSIAMLSKTKYRGGYGLGTGNSIPEYVPNKNIYAMLSAVLANE